MVLFPFLHLQELQQEVAEVIEEHPELFHKKLEKLDGLERFHWLNFRNLTAENPIFTRNRISQLSSVSLFTIISSTELKTKTAFEIRRMLGISE